MINLLERRTNITSGSLKKAGITELAKIFSHEISAMGLILIRCLACKLTCPAAPAAITALIWLTMFSLPNQAMANDCCLWVI